jgi:hypothetical protein
MVTQQIIKSILEIARWAPSGDNTQPWQFEIINDSNFVIYAHDTRATCVYDLEGHASHISLGALFETIHIAASKFGIETTITERSTPFEEYPVFDVNCKENSNIKADKLAPCIEKRTVQRKLLSLRQLTSIEKLALEKEVGNNHTVIWLEGWSNKFQTANMMFHNAKLRLIMPEGYHLHKSVIEWNANFSDNKLPDRSLGVSRLSLFLMKKAMKDWKTIQFYNKYLGGTLFPRIQLDYLPSIACGAHFILVAKSTPEKMEDYIQAGRAMQRFWLKATSLGLQLQPQLTPLIFSEYVRHKVQFSPGMNGYAQDIKRNLEMLIGPKDAQNSVFMGRIGQGKPATSRSIRKPLSVLLKNNS